MYTINSTWTDIKAFIDSRNISAQYLETSSNYHIIVIDGNFSLEIRLKKTSPANSDQLDFETNYKTSGNKTFTDSDNRLITTSSPFSNSGGFRARFKGFSGIALKNTTTSLDFNIPEERYINGVRLLLNNHKLGDTITFSVVDKSYTYAGVLYPATPTEAGIPDVEGLSWATVSPTGVILDTFGEGLFMDPLICTQPDMTVPYPAKLYAGLYMRIVYYSTGTVDDVEIKCNMNLHWKSI